MIEGCTNTSYELNYKFNGKELDAESNMYYYGARYYDPRISVWMSVDPLAEKDLRFTPYNYCVNNPFALSDPDGKFPRRPWEAKNVRDARKEAKRVGVEPSIWKGPDNRTWASVQYYEKHNTTKGPYSKVFKPEGKSWGEVYQDKIGKYVADGSNDLCNSGGTTSEGWKRAGLISGSMASAGSLIEAQGLAATVVTSLGLLNSIDDLGENAAGESSFEQKLVSQEAKNRMKVIKNTVSLINVTTSTWKINETIQSPFQAGSLVFDLKTLIENANKDK